MNGDFIVLTKPLGTQLATNTYHWMKDESESWLKLKESLTEEDVLLMYGRAIKSMAMLNDVAAKLMHKYEAHCSTDVTGFGIRGHAQNLVNFQTQSLTFQIDKLPIIQNVPKVAEILNRQEKLLTGKAVETSGGLFVCLPKEAAIGFCEDFERETGKQSWIIGCCTEGKRDVIFSDSITIVEVE